MRFQCQIPFTVRTALLSQSPLLFSHLKFVPRNLHCLLLQHTPLSQSSPSSMRPFPHKSGEGDGVGDAVGDAVHSTNTSGGQSGDSPLLQRKKEKRKKEENQNQRARMYVVNLRQTEPLQSEYADKISPCLRRVAWSSRNATDGAHRFDLSCTLAVGAFTTACLTSGRYCKACGQKG